MTNDLKPRMNIFEIIIGYLIIMVVILSPLPFGSVAPWAKNAILVVSLAMTAVWFFHCAYLGRIKLSKSPVWLYLLLMGALLSVYLVPMTPEIIRLISPSTADIYSKTIPDYAENNMARSLTLDSHSTYGMIAHWLALALILLLVMNMLRRRSQIVLIIITLTVVGVFEAIYGVCEKISEHPHVLWNERLHHLASVTGTYLNKNHFAGLMVMIISILSGLFIATIPVPKKKTDDKPRFSYLFNNDGFPRTILSCSLIIMMLGVVLSLSKIGIVLMVGTWIGFAFIFSIMLGMKKKTIGLLVIVLAILSICTGLGAVMVIDHIENKAYGDTFSWGDRIDLWKSSLALISEFPLLGTGPGTFNIAFERFQADQHGNLLIGYLNNDWLQILCELGLIGGIAAITGFLYILIYLIGRTFLQTDPFFRCIAVGSMMAVGSMLVQSMFDCSLYQITSNGVVFVIIMGIWHVSATYPIRGIENEKNYWTIPLRSKFLGWSTAGLLVILFCWPAVWAVRTGLADIQFNRFLALSERWGRADPYHFLIIDRYDNMTARDHLKAAIRMDETNPDYYFYNALDNLKKAELSMQSQAREVAREIIGSEIETTEPVGFQKISATLMKTLNPCSEKSCSNLLDEGKDLFERAIDLSPGKACYHLNFASLKTQLRLAKDALREAKLSIWLCPNKPLVLFRAGQIAALNATVLERTAAHPNAVDFAYDCFRRVLQTDSDYVESIYPLVYATLGGNKAVFQVTPNTPAGYKTLLDILSRTENRKGKSNWLDT